MPAEALESLIFQIVPQMVVDREFYTAIVAHTKENATGGIESEMARLRDLKVNFARVRSQAETLARRLSANVDLKCSRILGRHLLELEQNEDLLQREIGQAERDLEARNEAKFDATLLKGFLKDFSQVYENLPLEKKRRLNHALLSGIVSFIKRGEDTGEIEIRIRGDGSLKRT